MNKALEILLKKAFNGESLNQKQFADALVKNKIKIGDLTKGDYVAKSKHLDALKKATKSNGSPDAKLQADYKKLQGDYKKATATLEKFKGINPAKIKKIKSEVPRLKKKMAVNDFLRDSGVVDITSVLPHLDLSKAKLQDGGKITGLEDQIKNLKSNKSFLFKTSNQPGNGKKPIKTNGGHNKGGSETETDRLAKLAEKGLGLAPDKK